MQIIKTLSEQIEDELKSAEHYIRMAIKEKEDFPQVAQMFYMLSTGNVDRIDKIHNQVVSIIKEHRMKDGEPPAPMMAVYNYLHQRHIDKMVEIKKMQQIFKS